jgi:hypothetical protein
MSTTTGGFQRKDVGNAETQRILGMEEGLAKKNI